MWSFGLSDSRDPVVEVSQHPRFPFENMRASQCVALLLVKWKCCCVVPSRVRSVKTSPGRLCLMANQARISRNALLQACLGKPAVCVCFVLTRVYSLSRCITQMAMSLVRVPTKWWFPFHVPLDQPKIAQPQKRDTLKRHVLH